MHILIAANHSFRHIGGSEAVLKAISEGLVSQFDHQVSVISKTTKSPFEHNNVNYYPIPSDIKQLIHFVDKHEVDHLFVYSDYFYLWKDILVNAKDVKCKKSIALVGANATRENVFISKKFKENHHYFNIITHSDNYLDYTMCENTSIPVTVIPNGVDLSEFENNTINFKEKYKIKNEKIILCVSNFFPGKGQEYLVKVLAQLKEQRDDFIAVFVSSTVNFALGQVLARQCQSELSRLKIKHRFLVDISREDVVAVFNAADVFAFPSQKEVAPIVALECGAAHLPWVAMPVGNVRQLKGGLMIPFNGRDKFGFMCYGGLSYKMFVKDLNTFLDDKESNTNAGEEGYNFVKENHNWKKIVPLYNEIFNG